MRQEAGGWVSRRETRRKIVFVRVDRTAQPGVGATRLKKYQMTFILLKSEITSESQYFLGSSAAHTFSGSRGAKICY